MLIVLAEPGEPANIGAAARALKTMGLARLALVRPQCDPLSEQARWLAHASHDVLEAAQRFACVGDAVRGCALIGGFSARRRRGLRLPQLTLEEFVRLCRAAQPAPCAMVFGSEAHGLTNDDLAACTHLVTIPHALAYPSLNLAQAVMSACYEYQRQSAAPAPAGAASLTAQDVDAFIAHIAAALAAANTTPSPRFLRRVRAMVLHARMQRSDIAVLHALLDFLA